MNLLTDALPEAVLIGGVATPINTDFRACLRVVLACEDAELTDFEKQMILLANLYPAPPADPAAAYRMGVKFLDGGHEAEGAGQSGPRVFSWDKDQELMYAAFRQTHGIDLSTANLHWWQFLALWMDLGADTAFCQLTALRRRLSDGSASKDEQKMARARPDLFYLPKTDTRTAAEKERQSEFLRLVEEGEKRRERKS
jgi:hypothetical protein